MTLAPTWRDGLVNLLLQTAAAPAGLPTPFLQIYLVLPDEDGVGGVTPDPGDGWIGPVDVSGATFWPDSTGGDGSSLLDADVDFGTPTADPGPILGAAFVQSDGTLITIPEAFDDPMDVAVGVPFVLPAGSVAYQAV